MTGPVMVRVDLSGEVERDSMDYDQFPGAEHWDTPFDLKVPGFKMVRWSSSILELAAEGDELKKFLDDLDITNMQELRDGLNDLVEAVEALDELDDA